MERLLVTGGAGFIGSNFVRYILGGSEDLFIVNLDALTYAGSEHNLQNLPAPDRHLFVEGDICDRRLVADLLREHDIETIVHFAAESHVDRSILGPSSFVRTNIEGTFTLLEAARREWLGGQDRPREDFRFHHISTDEVYGSLTSDEPAFTEETAYSPNSPYAASKAASDHLVRAYGHTYGLPFTISNCSNNYGPYQFPEKLIPLAILRALSGKRIPIYGDGLHIRDWLYVKDHCEAIARILGEGSLGETYNIGAGNQPTNIELVETLCTILDEQVPDSPHRPHKSLIEFVPDRPGHDRRYAMNIGKIEHELGWRPKATLRSGLSETVSWYLQHRDWLTSIVKEKKFENWLDLNYERRGETT